MHLRQAPLQAWLGHEDRGYSGQIGTAARRTPTLLLTALLGVLAVTMLAMYLYDRSRRQQIAPGMKIGGVEVGGLSAAAARAKIEDELVARLDRPVKIVLGARAWQLGVREAGLSIDTAALVEQAVAASNEGSIFTRTLRNLTGGKVNRDVPLRATYSSQALRDMTARIAYDVDRPAVNATVVPSASGLSEVAGHEGTAVDGTLLRSRIARALTGAARTHEVTVPAHAVVPAVSTAQLAANYPAYIVVDRSGFRLRFYEHLHLALTYAIAVGMQGLETPAGLYHIQWKQVNPPWYVPNSSWAGALAGKTIPPGPEDPLKARFMSFDGGAGIHGIAPSEYSSIGHDASHGCVRMRIPDVIALYSRTPVGTPVYIA
jgi:lipoprotein-anchoring transpeptidase ErfK/SrfK